MRDPSFNSTSKAYPDIFAGEFPRVTVDVTISSGEGELEAGTVLGRVTADGEFIVSESAADDGSEDPIAVLAKDIDATSADVEAPVYLTAEFDEDALTFGTGHTANSTRWDLHARGIHLKTTVST